MAADPSTETFAAASKLVQPHSIAEMVSCGPSVDSHLAEIDRYIQAGYDHLILLQIGPQQNTFFDFFEQELRPRLHCRKLA